MFKLKSIGKFESERGVEFICYSPVQAPRSRAGMLAAMGTTVEIDGQQYEITNFHLFMPALPVGIGETIGILVK